MLSRKEIALRAGVSKTTVTRVLAGDETVLPENRKKIMQVVEDSGYTRNVLASNLAKNKRSTAVAMLVPDMTNYYYMQMFNEMVSCARKYGYTISIYSISTDTLDEVVNEVVCNRVCGIVNLGLDSISEDSLKKVRAAGIKIIYPGWPEDEFYQFNTDYEDGMAEAMAALKDGGAKRVCFIFGTKRRLLQDGRLKAFLKYGEAFGFSVSEEDIFFGEYTDCPALDEGYRTAKKLFQDGIRYDAIFCLNDMMAYGAICGIRDCGFKVPRDVSVIGFDNTLLDRYLTPTLSSIGSSLRDEAEGYIQYIVGASDRSRMETRAVFYPRGSIRRKTKLK